MNVIRDPVIQTPRVFAQSVMYLSRQQVGSDASPLHIAAGWRQLGVCPGWIADKYPFRRGSVRSECRSSASAEVLYPHCDESLATSANHREAGGERERETQ